MKGREGLQMLRTRKEGQAIVEEGKGEGGGKGQPPGDGATTKGSKHPKPAGSKALVQKLSTQPHPPRRPPHNRGEDAKLVVVMPGGPSRETGANGGTGATIESENQSHMAPA